MGTNFYSQDGTHIGKRSAAGMYCWDCHTTLCMGGKELIHRATRVTQNKWHITCPNCNQGPKAESLEESSAGRELGFNKEAPAPKTGVKSAASFNWAINPSSLFSSFVHQSAFFEDKYKRKMSAIDFCEMLSECPIHYYDGIGHEFT